MQEPFVYAKNKVGFQRCDEHRLPADLWSRSQVRTRPKQNVRAVRVHLDWDVAYIHHCCRATLLFVLLSLFSWAATFWWGGHGDWATGYTLTGSILAWATLVLTWARGKAT